MNLTDYYKNAKQIGELIVEQDSSILNALNYGPENDHPSSWVPNVQKALLKHYKNFPSSIEAEQVLSLYIQGEILEDRAKHNLAVKVGLICLGLGLVTGWFLWG